MKTYATEAELNAARARFAELAAEINRRLAPLRADNALRPGVNASSVVDHPLLRHYFDNGGAFPTAADFDAAVQGSTTGTTAADAADAYASRIAALERNLGRPALPAERLAIARETGHASAAAQGAAAVRESVALTNEKILAYLDTWAKNTGRSVHDLTALDKISIASTMHAQALAENPPTPVTDELRLVNREPQTPQERLAVFREKQSRGDAA